MFCHAHCICMGTPMLLLVHFSFTMQTWCIPFPHPSIHPAGACNPHCCQLITRFTHQLFHAQRSPSHSTLLSALLAGTPSMTWPGCSPRRVRSACRCPQMAWCCGGMCASWLSLWRTCSSRFAQPLVTILSYSLVPKQRDLHDGICMVH